MYNETIFYQVIISEGWGRKMCRCIGDADDSNGVSLETVALHPLRSSPSLHSIVINT